MLDSSAFFSMDVLPEEDHVCPPGVIKELEKYEDPRLALWGDMIRVSDCSKESLEKVEEAARKTGDIGRLSPVDKTVVALALDVGGTIWSDDYSIQNVARTLGLGFKPVGMKGIQKVVKWNYQCIGCRKWYKEKLPECPICGSQMKGCRRKRSGNDQGKMLLHLIRLPSLRWPRTFMQKQVERSDLNPNASASFLFLAATLRGFSSTCLHCVS